MKLKDERSDLPTGHVAPRESCRSMEFRLLAASRKPLGFRRLPREKNGAPYNLHVNNNNEGQINASGKASDRTASHLTVSSSALQGYRAPRPAATPRPQITASQPLRILVVEDNPVNQKVALGLLKKIGHAAKAVSNGKLAIEALARESYDIVFMDCQMPVVNGYEATEAIRRMEGSDRHTWIIALTANTMPGDREACIAAGMDDYLAKPVRSEALAATISRSPAHGYSSQGEEDFTSTIAEAIRRISEATLMLRLKRQGIAGAMLNGTNKLLGQ